MRQGMSAEPARALVEGSCVARSDAGGVRCPAEAAGMPAGGPSGAQREDESRSAARRIAGRLEERIGSEQFQRYFRRAESLRLVGGRLEVSVPTRFRARVVSQRFGEALRDAARDAAVGGSVDVSYLVEERDGAAHGDGGAVREDPESGGGASNGAGKGASRGGSAGVWNRVGAVGRGRRLPRLDPRLTLDRFVVGESNRLAYSAAVRIAGGVDAAALSPLFIYGECGMGKTHLLQGVARRCVEADPACRVRYVTGDAFIGQYVSAVQEGKMDGFRRALRAVDVLCLDDVHFLSNKKGTQEELLHTFDAIGMCGARIVIASDEHPRRIRSFSEALVSRFMCGMVVRLAPPDAELRAAVLRELGRRRGLVLDEGAVAALSERVADGEGVSVREMEGMLTKIHAVCALAGGGNGVGVSGDRPVDGRVGRIIVERALGLEGERLDEGRSAAGSARMVRLETVVERVCRTLRVERSELMGRGRHPRVVLARRLVAVLGREMTTASFPEIARVLGRPSHSTVFSAHRRIVRDIDSGAAAQGCADLGSMTVRELRDLVAASVRKAGREG